MVWARSTLMTTPSQLMDSNILAGTFTYCNFLKVVLGGPLKRKTCVNTHWTDKLRANQGIPCGKPRKRASSEVCGLVIKPSPQKG